MKYVKIILVILLACSVVLGVRYIYISLKTVFLYKTSQAMNVDFKKIIVNSIVNKYYNLLTKPPQHISTNIRFMNQLIKFRAELIQMLRGVIDINLTLYNKDGKIIFNIINDENIDNKELLLSAQELEKLSKGKEVFYRSNNNTISSIFPISNNYFKSQPLLFLKITRNFNNLSDFFIDIYSIIIIAIIILLMIFMFLIYYIYNKNTKILSKQYEINLQLKEAKEVAEQENISKSNFLANVSHELRTPLNSIIGFSEIIQNEAMGSIDNPHYKEYINDIYNSGVHLLSLINDILDFSKAEANKLTVAYDKFDLSKIIFSCIRMVMPKAEQSKIKLETKIIPDQIIMFADPRRMKQVIINLLSNSLKFTPEFGSITLTAIQNSLEKKITIEISDTGIGIAPQDIYKVMSVFGQADSDHSRKYMGTGLGLPLSKKLVELMGGTFRITSQLNVGTKVLLTFSYVEEIVEQHF